MGFLGVGGGRTMVWINPLRSCKILMGTILDRKQWITSVNRISYMVKLVLIHFKLRLSFIGVSSI